MRRPAPVQLTLEQLGSDPGVLNSLETLWAILPEARLVGGVVRDLIAAGPIADIDLGMPASPEIVMRRLADAGIRIIPTGLAHGTVTAMLDSHAFEITSLRRDEQTDGRHAVVGWTEDWREDAERRDFTINAMSLSRERVLFDYFGGLDDLRAGRVRFVGDPAARINEDALRILRFFRFDARFGAGDPDPPAVSAIAAAVPRLSILSAERIWSELQRILLGPRLGGTLALMRRLGVLDQLFPQGSDPARLAGLLEFGLPEDAILRLAILIRSAPAAVAEALRLSNADAWQLGAVRDEPVPNPEMDDAALRRLLADEPAEILTGRTWFAQAGLAQAGFAQAGFAQAGVQADWDRLRIRIAAIPRPEFPLAGRDLLSRGIAPGRPMGAMLAQAREWWLQGGCIAGRQDCLDHLAASGASSGAILPPDPPAC